MIKKIFFILIFCWSILRIILGIIKYHKILNADYIQIIKNKIEEKINFLQIKIDFLFSFIKKYTNNIKKKLKRK